MRVRSSPLPVAPPSAALRQVGTGGTQALRRVASAGAADSPQRYDGMLLGGGGKAFPHGTPLTDVPPVRPSNGRPSSGTLVFVNGMGETPASAAKQMQRLADGIGMDVVGLYNATEGSLKDLVQAAGDTLDVGTNKAVDSLADVLYSKLMKGEPVRLLAHSQGALITSRALTDVRNRMVAEGGLTRAQAEQRLASVGVETFGGAAPCWPDGPRYVHYVNRSDFVPSFLGVGRPGTHPGRDAKVISFGRFNPFGGFSGGHDTPTYLARYVPFDEAHRASR